MPKKLPSDIQNSIKTLLENSADPAVIGKRVGVHINTVNRYANKWIHDKIRKRGGIPSIVAESTRRYIKRQVIIGCLKTAKDVQMKLEELGRPMSYQSYMIDDVSSFLMRRKSTFGALMAASIIGKENLIIYSLCYVLVK
ncbi:hypothetical protein RO3G_05521 [Rhizopus delemar RA 99-880]|uniref:Uncharacterized protein n=1 Tax=Rhizopus delemar (strain RA 99-880 / ATCC MYA-4621 / FGSC 9543 / NRRL 43880) TaxID=246409 RepID=I1BX86_RHIO9|nr:hypothetical protein RO3G_05521 [Rhizopus delemar RA 99-880]|eukprot:EIE80816.1 hypothetical protein RO3G_05521 [Rhizopus delemar RA 99-880]